VNRACAEETKVKVRSANSRALIVFLAIWPATAGSAEAIPLAERHQSSGINSRFEFSGKTFTDYISKTKNVIKAARVDLQVPGRDAVLEGNSPFELKPGAECRRGRTHPYRRGVLMTHGLTDSPYFMRALGEVFQKQCFRVMAILLPGHGTRPGDLIDVTWQEWAKATAFGVNALADEADEVYLLGFSTGGALSVYQSLRDDRVRGLFLFAPAIRISPLGLMANWHEAYSWFAPRTKWIDIMPDVDPYKYESFPANAADQIHLLTQQLQRDLLKLKRFMLPVFIAASEDDGSVITSATVEFFKDAIHPRNEFVLYSTKNDFQAPGVEREKVTLVKSSFPDRRILSSAHTALVLPEGDPHYGINGAYANCLHYFPKSPDKYRQCKDKKEDYSGELTDENMKKGVIRRLMYNPSFSGLASSLSEFIERLPSD
jgi:esterase/lipase